MDGIALTNNNLLVLLCFHLVDLFYLKTCSFRGASPRTITDPQTNQREIEGIFCVIPPVARYGMTRCDRSLLVCRCCRHHSRSASIRMQFSSLTGVTFSPDYSHQFVNSYKVILNCPVVGIQYSLITLFSKHQEF